MLAALVLYAVAGLGALFVDLAVGSSAHALRPRHGHRRHHDISHGHDRRSLSRRGPHAVHEHASRLMSGASMMFLVAGGARRTRLALSVSALWRGFPDDPPRTGALPESRAGLHPAGGADRLDLRPLAIVGLSAAGDDPVLHAAGAAAISSRKPWLHVTHACRFAVAVGTLTMSLAGDVLQPNRRQTADHVVYAIIFVCSATGFLIIGNRHVAGLGISSDRRSRAPATAGCFRPTIY